MRMKNIRTNEVLRICELDNKSRLRIENRLRMLPLPNAEGFRNIVPSLLSALAESGPEIINALCDLSDPWGAGALLIKNSARSSYLPETPVSGGFTDAKKEFIEENSLLVWSLLLGTPLAHEREKNGALTPYVIPFDGSENKVSNEGSVKPLNEHTELGHEGDQRPSYTMLYCLRADVSAITTVIDARKILDRLRKSDLEVLQQPRFKIRIPESFSLKGTENVMSEPLAVLSGPADAPQITTEFNSTFSLDREAEAAFNRLRAICRDKDVALEICLQEYDTLLLDNRLTIHGRRSFSVSGSNARRWLARLNVIADVWTVRDALNRKTRVLMGTGLGLAK